ncbi:MAG TPA: AMIN domain-containing protein, partial [Silvibacterium sp.]|nr:AMIN domain-containing protein [Silvibacterium sp.]
MRKQQLTGTMFVSLLVLAGAAAAQTPSQLDRVNVVRGTDDIRVEMSASGTVSPKLSTLDSPARVVVDLPETVMATRQSRIAVGADGVKGVRIGMAGQSHPSTRIVVDLDQACAYELTPGAAGKLVLTLHANSVAKAASENKENKTIAASAPVPASKPASPFSPRVMDAQSTATPKAETPATKPTASSSPSDYVFVEPSYQAKSQAKSETKDVKIDEATDDPTVRAQEAAARFSDKTAAELLPVSLHASESQAQAQAPTITPAVNLAAEQKAQAGQQPASVGPKYTGEPISVNLKDVDLKDFFRLIHEISGLNVVLDPNVHGTLTVVLDDVPWDQALDIVLKNNDLARELEGNVL